jgi:hypothetical protein
MPQVEIASPLTQVQVLHGFRVSGWTDQNHHPVTCNVSGPANQTLNATSDANGNWETAATTVPVGTNYSVMASITVDGDTFSDVNEGVDVCTAINTGESPIPIDITTINTEARTKTTLSLTIRGRYSDPNPARILVMVVVIRRRKSSRVFSAGTIEAPTTGTWSIDLLAPTASPQRRVVVQAVRLAGTTRATGQTCRRV